MISSHARNSDRVEIVVEDSGPGISDSMAEQVFEPFFSTKEKGETNGLGLATVYGLTRQNNGYVSIDTEVGRGTTFRLLFPEVEPQEAGEVEAQARTESIGSVLVVEDNEAIRELVASVLDTSGFDVAQARDGVEAISLCQDGLAVDLLVTDVVMPQMGGVVLAKRLREIHPSVITLYISGHPFEQLNLPELDPETERYLEKPFTPADLRREVFRALSERGTAAALALEQLVEASGRQSPSSA